METQVCPSSFTDSQRWLPNQPLQIHVILKMGCQCGGCCHPLGLSSGPSDTSLSRAGLCVLEPGIRRKRCGQGGDKAATERNAGSFNTEDKGPAQARISVRL